MIEQQIYSRGSYGLNIKGPGHDTLAKSEGVSLQEAASYHSYFTLYDSGPQKDGEKIPVITRSVMLNGDSLLYQVVPRAYQAFDGVKHTLLGHLFLVREKQALEQAQDVRRLAGKINFRSDFEDGITNLPQVYWDDLADLNMDSSSALRCWTSKPERGLFLQRLAMAAWISLVDEKKVFIVPSDILDPNSALEIMRAIYSLLPYAVRKMIGYTTLHVEKTYKPGVIIYFLHPVHLEGIKRSGKIPSGYVTNCFVFDCTTLEQIQGDDAGLQLEGVFFRHILPLVESQNYDALETFYQQLQDIAVDFGITRHTPAVIDWLSAIGLTQNGQDICSEKLQYLLKNWSCVACNCNISVVEKTVIELLGKHLDLLVDETGCVPDSFIRAYRDWYRSVNSDNADACFEGLFNMISKSAEKNRERFFAQLKFLELQEYDMLVSKYINSDEHTIALFYERELSGKSNMQSLFEYLDDLKNSTSVKDDGLFEKQTFADQVIKRFEELYVEAKDKIIFFQGLLKCIKNREDISLLGNTLIAFYVAYAGNYIEDVCITNMTYEEIKELLKLGIRQLQSKAQQKLQEAESLCALVEDCIVPKDPTLSKWLTQYYQTHRIRDYHLDGIYFTSEYPTGNTYSEQILFSFFMPEKDPVFDVRLFCKPFDLYRKAATNHPDIGESYSILLNAFLQLVERYAKAQIDIPADQAEKMINHFLSRELPSFDELSAPKCPDVLLNAFHKALSRASKGKEYEELLFTGERKKGVIAGAVAKLNANTRHKKGR